MEEIEILNRLRGDHDNLRKLLFLLEQEIESSGVPDHHVLLGGLRYCDKYATDVHHPRESLVYAPLCAIPGKLSQRLGELWEQHEALAAMARQLHGDVEGACRSVHGLAALHSGLRHFLDSFRRHMAREEDFLFPAACIHLRPEEWARIHARLRETQSPVLRAEVRSHYAGVLNRLNTMAAHSRD